MILTVTALTVTSGVSAFANPVPYDSSRVPGPLSGILKILPTLPFALGEVDLSALGVSDAELASTGLSGPDPEIAASSFGGNLWTVDNDRAECPQAEFMRIQEAVDAAGPGDQIKVCPGTYAEQVVITTNGLSLFSQVPLKAIIQAPPTIAADLINHKSIVRVSGAQDVRVRHFTITGPGTGSCDSLRFGVRIDNGGSATIDHNHITLIRDTLPLSGCQNGVGVLIGRNRPDLGDVTVGSGVVRQNLIDGYQKGGIVVDNSPFSDIRQNEVVGVGPTGAIAQNGIQVSRLGHADVSHNKVSRNDYLPASDESTGILLFSLGPNQASVQHNDLFENEDGVALWFVDSNEVAHNRTHDNTGAGIHALNPATSNTIAYNDAFENVIFDCRDDNVPTSNMWIKDKGETENQPGLCKSRGQN